MLGRIREEIITDMNNKCFTSATPLPARSEHLARSAGGSLGDGGIPGSAGTSELGQCWAVFAFTQARVVWEHPRRWDAQTSWRPRGGKVLPSVRSPLPWWAEPFSPSSTAFLG